MTYAQTLEYLYNSLPEYQTVGMEAYKPGLGNTLAFNDYLGNPDRAFRSVHLAGTNGKGSTSHIIASVLCKAGFRVGLYTSPHLKDFRERIRVDGETISEGDVIGFVERHRHEMERIGLSFFEMTVGMAFDYFRRRGVDFAVVETGLGGRLDSTNIITPVLSVITNIGLDHVQMLGGTIPQIAAEKAGIIKPGVPVVVGESQPESDAVFDAAARDNGSELIFADREYSIAEAERTADGQRFVIDGRGGRAELSLDLTGEYQRKNIVTALAALDRLGIDRRTIAAGCAVAAASTGLLGRWQKLSDRPLVICDTGHNAHGLREVAAQIGQQKYARLYMVIGFVADKDLSAVLPLLPADAYYIFTQPASQRAFPAVRLAEEGAKYGLRGEVVANVPNAVALARAKASPDDMIFIGGSTFVVAEAI